jgi:hypothetical protein
MAGLADGVLDADQWAIRPSELARVIQGQLAGDLAECVGLADWVASRWTGPVLLDGPALDAWIREWEAAAGNQSPVV